MLGISSNWTDTSMSFLDVKNYLDKYRIASREVWNTCFLPSTSTRLDLFSQLDDILYKSIVAWEIDSVRCEQSTCSLILLTASCAGEILIGENRAGVMCWEPEDGTGVIASSVFVFNGFFDWNERGIRDMVFARVTMRYCSNPSLIGRTILVKWSDIDTAKFVKSEKDNEPTGSG